MAISLVGGGMWKWGGNDPWLDQELKGEWSVRESQLWSLLKTSFGDFHRRNVNIIENLQLGDG